MFFASITQHLSKLFLSHAGVTEEERSYGTKWYFPNGMRCDLFCKGQKFPILRFSRGAWMIKQEPALALLFDENEKVISRIILPSVDTIKEKAIEQLIERIYNAPKGIGVF